jgi:hypothetical protein
MRGNNLFQQVIEDTSANRLALEIKFNFHVFAETRTVVVSGSLGIPEGFQNGIRLEKPVPD